MTQETKEKNYQLYLKKLEGIGVNVEKFESIQNEVMNATYGLTVAFDGVASAYDGAMLEIVLKVLTPFAVRINEMLPEGLKVDKATLVKVCLLHQLSKAITIVPNDDKWRAEHKGELYKFKDGLPAIKMGLHSVLLCHDLGIELTPQEVEAMTITDRTDDDTQAKYFASPLSVILRQANELTRMQIKNKKS